MPQDPVRHSCCHHRVDQVVPLVVWLRRGGSRASSPRADSSLMKSKSPFPFPGGRFTTSLHLPQCCFHQLHEGIHFSLKLEHSERPASLSWVQVLECCISQPVSHSSHWKCFCKGTSQLRPSLHPDLSVVGSCPPPSDLAPQSAAAVRTFLQLVGSSQVSSSALPKVKE